MKLKTDKVLTVVIALLLLTTIFIILVSLSRSRQAKHAAQQIVHTQQVLITAEKLLTSVVNNETGIRGYILTGDKNFMYPVDQSKKEIYSNLSRLKSLIAGNGRQQSWMDSLSIYIGKRISFSDYAIRMMEENGGKTAASIVQTGEGKIYTDRIRAVIYQVETAERELLVQQTEANEKQSLSLNQILVAVVVAMLIITTFFIQKVRMDFVERKEAAAALAASNAALEQKVVDRTKELDKNEKRFRALVENNEAITTLTDENLNLIFRSASAARITGWQNDECEKGIDLQNVHPDDLDGLTALIVRSMSSPGIALPLSLRMKHKDGHYIWLEGVLKNMMHDPAVGGIISNMRDVTDQKKAEEKILKAQHLYFFISRINQIIVRTADEKTLFDEACSTAVQLGKFKAAWIGMTDKKTQKTIPVSYEGVDEKFCNSMPVYIKGITGRAAEEVIWVEPDKYFIENDIEEAMWPVSWKNEAIKYGCHSLVILPVRKFEKTVGTFSFYSSQKNFFDLAEIALLEKATGDVGFALEIFEREAMRKKAEEELITANKRFESISRATNDAVFEQNWLTGKSWYNEAFTRLFGAGVTPDIALWRSKLHPDDKDRVIKKLESSYSGTSSFWEDEFSFQKADGSYGVFYDRALINRDTSGKIISVIDAMTEITGLKKAEMQLRESEQQYRVLFYYNPIPCLLLDREDSSVLDVNEAAIKLYGYSRNEFLLLNVYQLRPPGEYERYRKHLQRMAEMPSEGNIGTWVHMKKDGTLIDVELHVHTIQYNNRPCRMTLINDITERKRAEKEIIREKNLSDSIINSLPGIFYLVSKEAKFLRWNTNFEKVSGYSGAEISKMHPLDFFPEEEKGLVLEKISAVFKSGDENVQANLLTKTKEKIPYYFTGTAIEYHGMTCLTGVGIDFTERKKAQEEIKETSDQLRHLTAHLQNVREEERKRIGREIHDELGQQLTAIKMDVAWVDKKIPEETVMLKRKLNNVIKLLDGSNHSIRRILTELRPSILDDHGLLEALEWLGNQFTASTGIPISFSTSETILKLPEQISTAIFRVYQEALTNIRRYAGASSVFTSLQIDSDQIIFTVADDGMGFDTMSIKNRDSFGILGMKERILLINGKFDIISSPGKGTKIILTIPSDSCKN